MKKYVIPFLVVGVFVLAGIIIIPPIVKPKIKAEIDKQIAAKVNAAVTFGDFGVSLFGNFPNLTASLEDFQVVNYEPFKGDTLLSMKSFEVEINLKSVLFGDNIEVKGITLDQPRISVKVLKSGQANYDIAKPQPEEVPDTAQSKFSASVDRWEIKNGSIVYDDKLQGAYASILGINHEGKGDFTQDEFDLSIKTTIDKFTAEYGGTRYLNQVKGQADMTFSIVKALSKYTFKDNQFKINDFGFGFEGYFTMPEKGGYDIDLTFGAKETAFKNIISLIPAVYLKGYEDLETKGTLAFNGFVKGVFDGERGKMPAYNVKLKIDEGYFKYPKLPTPVSNVLVDMEVDNKSGKTENTVIDIRQFKMNLGSNPIFGKVKVQNLKNYPIDADISAKINLAEMTQVFPIDSMTLKGLYELNIKANGVYDTVSKTIPKIDAKMKLSNGYVKTDKYPTMPLENLQFSAIVKNVTTKQADTEINLENFSMVLQGKPFTMQGFFKDLNDINYDLSANGEIDLDKITKIYPLEDKKVTGLLKANIKTKGKLSDAQAKKYDKMPTSGDMTLDNFTFSSSTVPQGVKITQAVMKFTPQNIVLEKYNGTMGKSDVEMSGQISNHIAFLLNNETIKGNLNFNSKQFDCNEWMTEDKSKPKEEAKYSVIELPKNIDFVFHAGINEVLYTNMKLNDAAGDVILKDGILRLNAFKFNTLGGNFVTTGTYNPTNLARPTFDFSFNMSNVKVQDAYKTFNTVQGLMPLAQNLAGDFSTGFNLKGVLKQDMFPDLTSLDGGGMIKLLDAALQNTDIIDKLKSLLKLDNLSNRLKDINLQGEIKAGRFYVGNTPFKLGDFAGTIIGSNGLDGSLDYVMELNVPKGRLGQELSSKLDQYVGTNAAAKETVKLVIKIGGNYKAPAFALDKNTGQDVKEEIKQKLEEQKQRAVDSVKQVGTETGKQIISDILKKDSTAQPPQKRAEDAINRIKDGFFGGFGKKKEEKKQTTPADSTKN